MTYYECPKCGHHYEAQKNPNVPFTSKCPKCDIVGHPSPTIPGWYKEQR